MARTYTWKDLLEEVRTHHYLQISREDLLVLLREGSSDRGAPSHFRADIENAGKLIRDHLKEMDFLRGDSLADERDKNLNIRLARIEVHLADLKKPHWTVNPNFWITAIGAFAAVTAAYFAYRSLPASKPPLHHEADASQSTPSKQPQKAQSGQKP